MKTIMTPKDKAIKKLDQAVNAFKKTSKTTFTFGAVLEVDGEEGALLIGDNESLSRLSHYLGETLKEKTNRDLKEVPKPVDEETFDEDLPF